MDTAASTAQIRPDTALAVAFDPLLKRVYFQDQDGSINEATSKSFGGWSNGESVAKAEYGSSIAVSYGGLNKKAWDGKEWYDGSLSKYKFQVSPSTKLAARYFEGRPRVYAQVVDSSLHEFKFDGNKWDRSYDFGAALYNTGIGATATGKFRLFYQTTEGTIIEQMNDGDDWKLGIYQYPNARPATPIAALSFEDGHRVFLLDSQNHIIESVYKPGPGNWVNPVLSQTANGESQLACLGFTGNNKKSNIFIYLQDEEGGKTITEFFTHDDENWSTNPNILPAK
ncbi:fucose-specific lectin [Xylariaceae sp. FL0662B]|nr:fucose-specific lectin [Xylariaceae sp. FL0662B]